MPLLSKRWPWGLMFAALLLFTLAVLSFERARDAAAHHSVAFMPDRIGGVGDTWMLAGQAYALSVFCALAGVWVVVRIVRHHVR